MIDEAADAVRARLGGRKPTVAIVLGSGLGHSPSGSTDAVRIPYARHPALPGADGDRPRRRAGGGIAPGRTVLVQSGRFHMYEGHPASLTALPVRVFARLGVGTLMLTNAAGGIRRSFGSGRSC